MNKNKIAATIIFIGIAVLTSYFYYQNSQSKSVLKQNKTKVTSSNKKDNTNLKKEQKNNESTSTEKNERDDKNDFHPEVSIQAFSEKKFNGKNLELGPILRENSAYTRYYITYESEDLTISGIMNVPKGSGPFPVLILNHGYIDPDVYTVGRGLKREQDYFARNGYVVLHPDYRNHGDSSEVEDPGLNFDLDYSTDVINAIKAVQNSEQKFFDKENIGMLGHSMGGGVALNIATTHPDLIDALALYAPVSGYEWKNFRRWTIREEGEKVEEISEEAQLVMDEYGTPTTSPQFWKNVSPINFVENIDDPIILQHGTADESVPINWSKELNQALNKADKEVTFHTYKNGKHEFIDYWSLFMNRNLNFFDQHLKN